jgi:hypothetical protein
LRWRRKGRHVGTQAAADRLADAEREVEVSRQRLAETHENVVKPLRAFAAHNSFAEIIAQSLSQGRRRRPG